MYWKIEFQYEGAGDERIRHVQYLDLTFGPDEYIPIPAVGDSVYYMEIGDDNVYERKVLSRRFAYLGPECTVVLVVKDVEKGEMAARLKE